MTSLVVALVCVAVPVRAQDQPSQYCDPEAYTAEDIDAALAACDAQLAGKSVLLRERIRAYLTRGDLLGLKGQPEAAMSNYDQAVKLIATAGQLTSGSLLDKETPDSVSRILAASVLYHRGEALRVQGQMPLAVADYSRAIDYYEDDAQTYWHRAQAYEAGGQLALALRDLDKAATLEPDGARYLIDRGRILTRTGALNRAMADFDKALALSPNDANAQAGREAVQARLRAQSQQTSTRGPSPAVAERRVALVIGNSAYRNAPRLPNPARDAAGVADALRRVGFATVTLETDLPRDKLTEALRAFAQLADEADWALVYYAGHGIELGGANYLVPVDAKLSADRDIGFEAVPLESVLSAVEGAKKLRIVVLDACRDNPFASQMRRTLSATTRAIGRGLASVEPERGTLVVYAAKHGETALDGDVSGNSPFATAFIKNVQVPGLEVRRMFDVVRDDVMDITGRRQQPFSYGSVSGRQDFYFVAAQTAGKK
ncbi:caspase family protein [Bradyrhizobium prioriisuperbiae]|uniref:caspase family protein n=1 Tax=Bradyrhizobium prioriisuperbiae TaxID=2854389 RepID=UPI0028F0A213|nr:caspase family protein [Bradyrhizobium prioritasuperba]